MKILLLGGTADARRLCDNLIQQKFDVTYSIAGLVRTPTLDCPVLVGGFRKLGGLTEYLSRNQVDLVLDVTHPYAKKMSDQAVLSGQALGVPVWRFHRPAWERSNQDKWHCYQDFEQLVKMLENYKRPLLSAGQFSLEELTRINALANIEHIVLRTAVKPKFSYEKLAKLHWLKAIGPFFYQDESLLIQTQDIDVIVSKNSGGSATSAKLQVANRLRLAVLMLERPNLMGPDKLFNSLDECFAAIKKHSHSQSKLG